MATEFQNSLQDFINWLTLAEQGLNVASPPSLILNTVLPQVEEHKVRASQTSPCNKAPVHTLILLLKLGLLLTAALRNVNQRVSGWDFSLACRRLSLHPKERDLAP